MKNRLKGKFFQGDSSVPNNKNLSLQAIGLYSHLCTKPDDWDFSYRGLESQLKAGEKAIRSAVRELVHENILIRIPTIKNYKGQKYRGFDWVLHPTPEDLIKCLDPIKKASSRVVAVSGTTPNGDDLNGNYPIGNDISNNELSNNKLSNNEGEEETPTTTSNSLTDDERPSYITTAAERKKQSEIVRFEDDGQLKSYLEVENLIEKLESSVKGYQTLNAYNKKNFIVEFCLKNGVGKSYKGKNDVWTHLINSLKYYQPVEENKAKKTFTEVKFR